MRASKKGKRAACGIVACALALTISPGAVNAQDNNAKTPLGANFEGKTQIDSGSEVGRFEGRLLSSVAVKQAAKQIVDATGTDFTSLTIAVLPLAKADGANDADMIGGDGWDVLQSAEALPVVDDMVAVKERLDDFRQRYSGVVASAVRGCKPRFQMESESKGGGGTFESVTGSITGMLNTATPLLNLFKQDFTYGGFKLGLRPGMLVTAVRGEIATRRRVASTAAGADGLTMSEAVDSVERELSALPDAARCEANANTAEAARAQLAAQFDAFRAGLSRPGKQAGLSIIEAADDQLMHFGPHPATLVLAIDASGSSVVERRNLTTMFGAESVTVSTGLVVSYEFYEPKSGGVRSLKAAGVISCLSGAVGIRSIHKAKEVRSRSGCL